MTFKIVSVPPPLNDDESAAEYGYRLEKLGFDEMRIRQKILEHFPSIDLNNLVIFNATSDARIRYVTMIHEITPAKPSKGLVKKLAASIGISEEEAQHSIGHYEKVGRMPFVPWT